MKVVQFLPYFPPHTGGLENVAQNIAKNLVKYTYAKMLIITSDIGQKEKGYHKFSQDGYEIIAVPSFEFVPYFPCFKFWTKGYRNALKELKNYNPDVIHTHTRFFLQSFHGGLWAKFHHKKRVHTEHGSGYVKGIGGAKEAIAWIYDQTLGRLVFGLADKIVSINKVNLNFISKFTNKSKCLVIYNGIEDYSIKKIENKTGIVRLTYMGRLSPLKGVDILLKAISKLLNEGINNFKLNIIGDGEEYANLNKYIKENKLDNVQLLGKKPYDEIINDVLPNTDVFINPSHQEGLPTTVLEGLISKCVVVATDVGGTSEISDKGDLILVKAGNMEELKKGIKKALNNYKNLQGESYKEIKERFSWEKNVREYFSIYEK